jgi:hypothetical protein
MKIQSMWIGESLSKIERACIQSFLNNNINYYLYVYEDVKNIPDGVKILDANNVIRENEIVTYKEASGTHHGQGGSYAGFADRFRWTLMYKLGGCWVDTDVCCIKKFETPAEKVAGELHRDSRTHASTQFLHFNAGNSMMEDFYDHCNSIDCSNIKWGDIGPKLIDDKINNCAYWKGDGHYADYTLDYRNFNAIPYWDWRLFLSNSKDNVKKIDKIKNDENVFCMHLWNEMWRRAGVNKNGDFDSGSFISNLIKSL